MAPGKQRTPECVRCSPGRRASAATAMVSVRRPSTVPEGGAGDWPRCDALVAARPMPVPARLFRDDVVSKMDRVSGLDDTSE